MEPTKETILAFAERFGLLSGGQSPTPFYRWEREILQMRFLIAVWDAVTTRKTRFLQTHFTAVADGRFRLPFPELLLRIHIRESQTFFSERCSILQAARQYLAEALTAKCDAIRPKIVVNPRSNELQIEMVQESLGGALWMQFTESIAAQSDVSSVQNLWAIHRAITRTKSSGPPLLFGRMPEQSTPPPTKTCSSDA